MSFSVPTSQNGRFRLYVMPTAVHSPRTSSKPDSKVCAFERAFICLLDDDVSMLKALDRLLTAEGFHVEKFSHPAAFLAAIGDSACPLAILDVWMPDMNGLEVQAAMRKDSPGTRVIFMSGRDDPAVRQAALDAGACGFLSKPFDDEGFLQLVRKTLAR